LALFTIDGNDLVRSLKAGCIKLEHNRDSVDLLNVFPVPDGDTGTNMYLTLLSAVKEGEKNREQTIGKVARSVSRGSLMGARGNSGVILSQIFRGMARVLEGKEQADALDLALAFKAGANTAYEAVMKPVEGTILTVVRETSRSLETEAKNGSDIISTLLVGLQTGQATLAKTPSMLPILKEAGVVDAGGQGFLYFLEGFLEGLVQEKDIQLDTYREKLTPSQFEQVESREVKLDYQYCTETLIKGQELEAEDVKDHLRPLGDSMLVVGGDDLIKVHIHSNHPGKVLETCLQFGQLSDIKINNMLEEVHEHINNWEEQEQTSRQPAKKTGIVAVSAGDGIREILKSLGVDEVVEGGQSMNPSTEELLNACQRVNGEAVIILPNNSNVIMTAQQVVELCDKKVRVIPTRSVMQTISALIDYNADEEIDSVVEDMTAALKNVVYAEVTHAVRDSQVNGLTIKEGDTIGILEDKIELTADNPGQAVEKLLQKMVNEDSQLITYFYGNNISEQEAKQLQDAISAAYPDCEVEIHQGGQPHYSYLLSVE